MRHILYIGMLLSTACSHRQDGPMLQTGDLLFQCGTGAMTEAITDATSRSERLNFTHVGIVLHSPTNGAHPQQGCATDSVLEATTEGGVRIVPLEKFLARSARIDDRPAVAAMRMHDTAGIAASVARARKALGASYDYSFRPDNGRYYCSELVYETYLRPDGTHCFTARPMNFRAIDGTMPRYWLELFERLGELIPEGLPGTNPNDLSQEESLYEIRRWF